MRSLQDVLAEDKLTPKELLDLFENPAHHISSVRLDNTKVEVIESPWPSFDSQMILKRNRGELTIVGARPGVGKSAFIFQLAAHVAKTENVLVFSLEMDKESIKSRLLSQYAKKHLQDIQRGTVDKEELSKSEKLIDGLNLYIDDRAGLTAADVVNVCHNYGRRFKIGMIVLDYLQVVTINRDNSRVEEVGEITKTLKELAKHYKCSVVAASQLNRDCEKRGKETGDYSPMMSDLRDSGCIEQDADIIIFLNRHEVFDPDNCPKSKRGVAEVNIAKNRNGMTGLIKLRWIGSWTKFSDPIAKEELQDGKESKIEEKSNQEELVKVVNKALVWGKSKPKDLNGAIPLDLDIPPLVGDCYDDI